MAVKIVLEFKGSMAQLAKKGCELGFLKTAIDGRPSALFSADSHIVLISVDPVKKPRAKE